MKQCQGEALNGALLFRRSDPSWAEKFVVLEAKAALSRGQFDEVLRLLQSRPTPSDPPDLAIATLTLRGIAYVRTHNFPEAEHELSHATELCDRSPDAGCGELLQARGLLASEHSDSDSAESFYEKSLAFARAHGDPALEANALLNLGAESLTRGHFDEAIDRSAASYDTAHRIGAKLLEAITQGNIAWAYYRLGDHERALDLATQAEKAAAELGDVFEQENELTNIGYIQMEERNYDLARQSFRRALQLAEGISAQQDIYNALRVLARLSVQTGDLDQAGEYANRALSISHATGSRSDELYPILAYGQIAARRGNLAEAESRFGEVKGDPSSPVFLKWEAEHELALLHEKEGRADSADREYRAALTTFEGARKNVSREDSQLSFFSNAVRIYDDYIHFLIARGRTEDALRWADYSRAQTLAEGLGLLARKNVSDPPRLGENQLAKQADGVFLFYWLGEKQSYLWVIAPEKTSLFTLPPGPEIDEAVRRYRQAIVGPQDVLESNDSNGVLLYRMLIAPAQALISKDMRIFILPDGSLNNLNFETLLVPEPRLHYWIEDVTVANLNSLRVLAASHRTGGVRTRNLLLIGDSIAPSKEYPELPGAAAQIQSVSLHYTHAEQIFRREQATPAAYLASKPEQYSYIHFVAHGTASRLIPLDSAIILSGEPNQGDSFKLYARDIIQHPLRADLVTISSCYGAGQRAYSGEGLVGLSWAFLRAGAHNVVAALWEATDASTAQLMDRFYEELDRGQSPNAALRTAKLSLLHGSRFRNPFYWAPFQLYGQGQNQPSH